MSWYTSRWVIYSALGLGAGGIYGGGFFHGTKHAKKKLAPKYFHKDTIALVKTALREFAKDNNMYELEEAYQLLRKYPHVAGAAKKVYKTFMAFHKYTRKLSDNNTDMTEKVCDKVDKLSKACAEACKAHGTPPKGALVAAQTKD